MAPMTEKLLRELKQTKPFRTRESETLLTLLRTADTISHAEEQFFRAHGITATQYNALRILRGSAATGLPCHKIGERLVTRVPDVTRLIDRLEKAGLVRRERSSQDRRVVRVHITEAGAALLRRLDEPVEAWAVSTLGHLSEREHASLCKLLDKARRA